MTAFRPLTPEWTATLAFFFYSAVVGRHLILYDGVCGLCNRLNQFVLARDRQGVFDFAAQQSVTGHGHLQRFGADPAALTTLYVIADYRTAAPQLLGRARAVLFILGQVGRPWSWLRLFWIVPDGVLNSGYDLVARNRYRLFGQYDSCPMPTPETRARFIDV